MSKVASVMNMEFETPDEVATFIHFMTETHEELSRDLEQLIAVRTGDTSLIAIRVHNDQESFDRYSQGVKGSRDKSGANPKDFLKLEGPVTVSYTHLTLPTMLPV